MESVRDSPPTGIVRVQTAPGVPGIGGETTAQKGLQSTIFLAYVQPFHPLEVVQIAPGGGCHKHR